MEMKEAIEKLKQVEGQTPFTGDSGLHAIWVELLFTRMKDGELGSIDQFFKDKELNTKKCKHHIAQNIKGLKKFGHNEDTVKSIEKLLTDRLTFLQSEEKQKDNC